MIWLQNLSVFSCHLSILTTNRVILKITRPGFLTAFLLLAQVAAFTQRQRLEVNVKDSSDRKFLSKATVIILAKKDSVLLDFGITDSLGKYLFKNVNTERSGSILVSMAGYKDFHLQLAPYLVQKVKTETMRVDVLLRADFTELNDVVVSGSSSMIRMNKDTLEFNPGMFGNQPNAVLEDLLRKLPGVEIRNGKEVYVNGQRVNRILVDGKEFFSSDPIVILKNLPADIIARVQVVDEKNTIRKELREKQDIPKTINLKLKKEFKSGAFGKFFGGYGSSERFEAGGILNTFRDTLQVSLIGSANNQGRNAFSWEDLNSLGGFGRSEGMGGRDAGDIANGNREQSIETKKLAGINTNYNLGKTLQINAQYFYDQSDRRSFNESRTQQFIQDSVLFSNGSYRGDVVDRSHKASMGLRWKQDSTGYLNVQIKGDFSRNDLTAILSSNTFSKNTALLSDANTGRNTMGFARNLSLNAGYEKTLTKLKIDWSINTSYAKTGAKDVALTESSYLRIMNNFRPDSLRQIRNDLTPNRELNFSGNVNKHFGERHTLSISTDMADRTEQVGGDTYQFSTLKNEDVLIPSLSARLKLRKLRTLNSFAYRYGVKGFNIQIGMGLRTLFMSNRYNYDSIPVLDRSYDIISPSINLNFKGIGFSYKRDFQEPYTTELRPVVDSSNPLSVVVGNPNLKPAKMHSFNLNYYKYFERPKITMSLTAETQLQDDVFGNAREVFPDGKTIYSYRNFDRSKNAWAYMSVNKSYNKNHWNYDINLFSSVSGGKNPMMLNKAVISTKTTWVSAALNLFVGYDSKYTWRGGYNISTSQTKNSDLPIPVTNTTSNTFYSTIHVKVLKRLSWDGNINYTLNPGTAAGFRKQWTFCDMALTLAMFKKEQMQLKLSAFDIFNQNIGQFRYTYMNFITDTRSLVQKQYFMATVFYTFKKL